MDRLITKEKVFVQTNQLAEILINSNGYEDFHNNIVKNNIVCEESKNYEHEKIRQNSLLRHEHACRAGRGGLQLPRRRGPSRGRLRKGFAAVGRRGRSGRHGAGRL